MAAGDVTNGIGHGHHGETKGEGNAEETQAKGVARGDVCTEQVGEIGGDGGATAAAKN